MEKAKALVLDASVVVKWFNVEQHSDQALKIKELYEHGLLDIIAPDLLIYEVGNALRYNPNFGAEDVKVALNALEGMQLDLWQLRGEFATRAVETCFAHGLTLYDACYIALADLMDIPYYTADEEVVRRVSTEKVKHISDFKPGP